MLIIDIIENIHSHFHDHGSVWKDLTLFYEVCFWIFSLIYKFFNDQFEKIDIKALCDAISKADDFEFFWKDVVTNSNAPEDIFANAESHYYKSIMNRYIFIANYYAYNYSIDVSHQLNNKEELNKILELTSDEETIKTEINKYRLNKADPTSESIEDILDKIRKSKFLIRPNYQRSEVANSSKSSYLMESIMLGIKIPPIFICKREDGVSEVIDGQQRLLSIIGFLGQPYVNEEGKEEFSKKNMYKLVGLKYLKELNNKDYSQFVEEYEEYKSKILEFQLNVVEIDAEQNPNFDSLDLFLRLNKKPYPISENSFEMWNASINKDIILKIKKLAANYSEEIFRGKDLRMKTEELITILAYIDYKHVSLKTLAENTLAIYVKNNQIAARIKNKKDITKLLNEVTRDTKSDANKNKFIDSIGRVEDFLNKILLLTENLDGPLKIILSDRKYQYYYLLWIILLNIDYKTIETDKERVVKNLENIFSIVLNVPHNYTIQDFFDEISTYYVHC